MEIAIPIMTDDQLIEEYSKEIFGFLYTPECKISVEKLIEHSRRLRKINGELTEVRKKAYKEGFDSGMRMAERHKVPIETLKLLTIKQLANLIETYD
jgi:hypothetical protein